MAKRKVWREWTLRVRHGEISREVNGWLVFRQLTSLLRAPTLTPTEARRLYTKLASDFRD